TDIPIPHLWPETRIYDGWSFKGCCWWPPGPCRDEFDDGIGYDNPADKNTQPCSQKDCVLACKDNKVYKDACKILKGGAKLACEILFTIGGKICEDYCLQTCTKP